MKNTHYLLSLAIAAGLVLAACQSQSHATTRASVGPPVNVQAQVQRGGEVYGNQCAHCHGDAGQGTRKAPPLVGSGALPLYRSKAKARKGAFHNAMDIAVFATQNMPPDEDDRAEMREADYWAVLAFALSANGVNLTEPVGPHNAASIVLHP